jgi:lysyl-tRNA synthetase, class II
MNETTPHETSGDTTVDGANYRAIRLEKIEELKRLGYPVYPERYETTHTLQEASQLPDDTTDVSIAGRIIAIRIMGKLSFFTLQDLTGRMQLAFQKGKEIPADVYDDVLKKLLDTGDFLGVKGTIFTTKKGEKTVLVESFAFLGKGIRTLPEKFHGMTDRELIYRQRYNDLIANRDSVQRFRLRTQLINTIRGYLNEDGFEEVETPILINKASGALANPFVTHHRALDIDFYLRIAPETYLKRLIVAGYTKVYEFAKCFRNEGMDPSHLQEFTMLEYYCAYWNYEDNMRYTEQLMAHLLEQLFGTTTVHYQGVEMDFTPPYKRITFRELLLDRIGLDILAYDSADSLRSEIRKMADSYEELRKIDNLDQLGWGTLIDQVYKKTCRDSLIAPTFLTGHPIELSPLARQNNENPAIVDRFQLVANGWELINAYSELVDPIEQRKRLVEQASARDHGDDEAHPMDEDYLQAMEMGMPPISGWGMGIDRFMALITEQTNLRDVVLFPLMRPLEIS